MYLSVAKNITDIHIYSQIELCRFFKKQGKEKIENKLKGKVSICKSMS